MASLPIGDMPQDEDIGVEVFQAPCRFVEPALLQFI